MTRREWNVKVKQLLRVSEHRPRIASRGFHRLAIALESAAAIYLALVGWLLAGLMVDDSVAFRMAASD